MTNSPLPDPWPELPEGEDFRAVIDQALDRFQAIAAKLLEQRDEALRQRDLLIAAFGLRRHKKM